MGEKENTWASIVELVGLFEIDWKAPYHDMLVKLLNTCQIKKDTIFIRLGKKVPLICR
jgi:hypothetical protein